MQNYFEKYDINLEQNEILLFEKFLQIFKLKNSQINLSAIRDDE
jgi:16S rRNA G527 N7-methylase RsmG